MFGLGSPKFTETEKLFFARQGFSINGSEISKEYATSPKNSDPEKVIKAVVGRTRKGYKITCFVEVSFWDCSYPCPGDYRTRKRIKDSLVFEKMENVIELLKLRGMISEEN